MRYDVDCTITVDCDSALEAEITVIDFLSKNNQEYYINDVKPSVIPEQLEFNFE